MKSRRIVFLDFDGVLATDDYDDVLIGKGSRLRDNFGRVFDPSCVAALRRVVDSTGADIVITSSWRHYLNILELRLMWWLRKMPGKIVGRTPRVSGDRGLEIQRWLSRHRDVEGYVILDDMDQRQFEPDQACHLLTCNHMAGLSQVDSDVAIRILMSVVG